MLCANRRIDSTGGPECQRCIDVLASSDSQGATTLSLDVVGTKRSSFGSGHHEFVRRSGIVDAEYPTAAPVARPPSRYSVIRIPIDDGLPSSRLPSEAYSALRGSAALVALVGLLSQARSTRIGDSPLPAAGRRNTPNDRRRRAKAGERIPLTKGLRSSA